MRDEDHLAGDRRVPVDVGEHGRDTIVDGERHRIGGLGAATGEVDGQRGMVEPREQPVPEGAGRATTVDEDEREVLHRTAA